MEELLGLEAGLLTDYLAGEASVEQIAAVERWAQSSAECQALLDDLKLGWKVAGTTDNVPELDIQAFSAGVVNRIQSNDSATPGEGKFSRRSVPRWASLYHVVRVVPVLLVLGATFGIKHIYDSPAPEPNYHLYTTKPGQRANITLANGTSVTLGPATTLKVEESRIDLSGDALFKVKHSSQRPFTILSHGVTTRVLGTEFVVRAYDASWVRVAVRSGKVSVQSPVVTTKNVVTLSSGEGATVASNAIPVVTRMNDMTTDFAWASGDLVLRDVPLGEALVRLSRWYGLEFRVDDSTLLNLTVESEFPATFDVRRLNVFAKVLGARVNRSGNVITLSRK